MIELTILASLCGLYCYYQNNAIQVSSYDVSSSLVPRSFDGYRIFHISDLHNKQFGHRQQKLKSLLVQLQPDAVCITGDLIDSRRTTANSMQPALDWIDDVSCPIYYVPGNHESRVPYYSQLVQALQSKNVHVLHNESMLVQRGRQAILFTGIQDPRFFPSKPLFAQQLANLRQPLNFQILLSHRPEQFTSYHTLGYDLVLSGHAHGGQFRLPGTQGLYAPHQGLFPRYTQGLHKYQTTAMAVSRGLGNSKFPIRINNRPQILMLTLKHT